MFFRFPPDARWNPDCSAVEFGVGIGEYEGVVRVPRPVFQSLLEQNLAVEAKSLVDLVRARYPAAGARLDELSAAFSVVPQVKFLIRRLKLSEARQLADFALNCESGSEILARSQALARRIAPGLFENQDL